MIKESDISKIKEFIAENDDVLPADIAFDQLHVLTETYSLLLIFEEMDVLMRSKYQKRLNDPAQVKETVKEIVSITPEDKLYDKYILAFERVLKEYMT